MRLSNACLTPEQDFLQVCIHTPVLQQLSQAWNRFFSLTPDDLSYFNLGRTSVKRIYTKKHLIWVIFTQGLRNVNGVKKFKNLARSEKIISGMQTLQKNKQLSDYVRYKIH